MPPYLHVIAYVLVRMGKGEKDLVSFLRTLPQVREAFIVYGEYDVIAKVETESMRELTHLVLDQIRSRFPVERTSTLIVV